MVWVKFTYGQILSFSLGIRPKPKRWFRSYTSCPIWKSHCTVLRTFFFLGSDNSASDLALLANCNHTIQFYGTFSCFAGFLANRQVHTKLFQAMFQSIFTICLIYLSVNTQKSLANIKLVGHFQSPKIPLKYDKL